MLWRAFNKLAAFWSTTFFIVVIFIFFPSDITNEILLTNITSTVNSIVFIFLLSVRGLPHNPTSLFMFFLTVLPRREPMLGAEIVWALFISVTLIGQCFNMLPRTMRSKSAADGRPIMLYADLDFSAFRISRFLKPSLFSWTVCTKVTSQFLPLGLQLW